MYAIIETGSKQYQIEEGDIIDVELLKSKDKNIEIKTILLIKNDENTLVGAPYVDGAYVEAEILEEIKEPKVIAFKYFRRKSSKKKIGHRQKKSRIKIKKIKMA